MQDCLEKLTDGLQSICRGLRNASGVRASSVFFKTENAEEMMRMIRPALWLLDKYNHTYYLVYTNTPEEIVYEDKYQVVVKTKGILQIEELQESWSKDV